jgi:hypothetical protein
MLAARNSLAHASKPYLAVAVATRQEELMRQAKTEPLPSTSDEADSIAFQALADDWRRETSVLSGMDIEAHPAYLKIIRLGWPALPLILQDLRDHGGHWFWALEAITGKNPADEATNVREATTAWLEWAKEHAIIE